MKRLLAGLGLLSLLSGISYAGTPQETLFPNQFPMSNNSIIASTFTIASGLQGNLSMSLLPGTVNNGGASISCRNCFTRFLVQMSTNVTVNIIDQIPGGAGTTDYVLFGAALAASGDNTLSMPEDHLGPVCFPAGDTTNINAVVTIPFAASNPISVNAEGYTTCGGSNNRGL